MATFNGYLLANPNTNEQFSNRFILVDSYDTVPNITEDIEAYRDDNTRELKRIVADGKKTTIKFTTIKGMNIADKTAFMNFFENCIVDAKEGKIRLKYWNDREMTYKTSYFYLPPAWAFHYIKVLPHDIIYNSIDVELIEY